MTDPVLSGQPAVDALVKLLDLEQRDDMRFEGKSPQTGQQRVFGGQVAAQALVAAGRTVEPDRPVNSLHGYFVRPGDPAVPIDYAVENIRDGRSFSIRRCVAQQHGKTIFFMSASFHIAEDGLDHAEPMPPAPTPDELPTVADWIARYPDRMTGWRSLSRPIDVRYVGEPGFVPPGDRPASSRNQAWLRIDGKLPDDPLLHVAALTFASDMTLLDVVLSAHGESWGPGGWGGTSLDHALWFHRPFRADQWFLYDCWSPTSFGARGLATGRFFTADGRHVASAVQEGLIRRI